jgi:hypothetical protein
MSDELKLPEVGELSFPQWQNWLVRYNRVLTERDHRIEKLEAALRNVMIGGNHVALLIGVGHPPHTATHDKALTHYGAGDAYDAWCCWKTIMEARKALEGKDD